MVAAEVAGRPEVEAAAAVVSAVGDRPEDAAAAEAVDGECCIIGVVTVASILAYVAFSKDCSKHLIYN